MVLGDFGEELGAGGGDGDGEHETECVSDDVSFAADELLGWVDALAGQGDGGGGFGALAVDQAGAWLAGAAFGLADFAA